MDWDDLRIFLTIARTGQILAAAKRLGLNHATVARRLDRLESKLHSRLFTRRSTGCELTDTGAALLLRAERMEAEALAAESSTDETAFSLSGTVRVGAPDGFGTAFLAPRLWKLSKSQPQLTVQLVPMARAFSLSRREADLAITIQQPDQGRLVCRKLVDYGLGLYAATNYLAENPAPAGAHELHQHRLIGHVEDLIYSPSLNYAEDAGLNLSSTYEISSAIGQLEAVIAGAGIGILHHFMARGHDNVVPVLPQINIQRTYWLVFHQSTANIANIRFVSDAIASLVQAEKAIFQ